MEYALSFQNMISLSSETIRQWTEQWRLIKNVMRQSRLQIYNRTRKIGTDHIKIQS